MMARLALERVGEDPQNESKRKAIVELQAKIVAAHDKAILLGKPQDFWERLPFELMFIIFRGAAGNSPIIPMQLSHVCRRWRAVALGSPTLWQILILSNVRPLQKIWLWRQRSQSRIKELQFKEALGNRIFACHNQPAPDATTRDWICKEVKEMDWQFLEICRLDGGCPRSFETAVDKDGHGIIQHLKEFRVTTDSRHWHEWPFRHPTAVKLNSEPSTADGQELVPANFVDFSVPMQTLRLGGIYIFWPLLALYFSNLITLEITNYPQDNFERLRSVMEAVPNLEKLVFKAESPSSRSPFPDVTLAPLTMSRLRHFELCSPSPVSAAWVTADLSLPVLETLRLHGVPDHGDCFDAIIRNMDVNVGSLIELSLRETVVQPGPLARALLQAPLLERLELCSMVLEGGMNSITEMLTKTPAESMEKYGLANLSTSSLALLPITCPSLTHVDLSNCQDLTTGPVLRMVSSRIKLAPSVPDEKPAITPRSADADLSMLDASDAVAGSSLDALSPTVKQIQTLLVDGCPRIEAETLPWLRSHVPVFSCKYISKKEATEKRRNPMTSIFPL
ncbi:hypothetical protein EWM64_g3082 [Hericium alpestre]|uniref:Uncharacterized protein n=1 Tax=Hericium alpestre TaxID=135208 RepID=A0A4Z0A392_9AGAM|nr:hypothetical protein EWM64_g3082 [Hericium alpestre]